MSHEPTRLMACERARGGQCIRVAVHRGSPRERRTEKREKNLFRPVSRVWHPYCTISAPSNGMHSAYSRHEWPQRPCRAATVAALEVATAAKVAVTVAAMAVAIAATAAVVTAAKARRDPSAAADANFEDLHFYRRLEFWCEYWNK